MNILQLFVEDLIRASTDDERAQVTEAYRAPLYAHADWDRNIWHSMQSGRLFIPVAQETRH